MFEYDLSEEDAHRIIERGILASGDLDLRFVQMKTCEAVSGIMEKDLPLLGAKFGAAVGLVQTSDGEKKFERVAELTRLQGSVFGRTKVEAEKSLEIRGSGECRAFRDWLANTASLSDMEVKNRIRGLNTQI